MRFFGVIAGLLASLTVFGAVPAVAVERDAPIGWHVPWAIGGPRVVDGVVVDSAPDRPGAPVGSVRLWDTRTAWLHVEPARGRFNWAGLDAHVAAATEMGAADVTLVLAGAPSWAADGRDDVAAPWLGAGSNRPPVDIADWANYVSAVAERYRGRVTAYEVGNEANLDWFWTGTPAQYAGLVVAATSAIRAVDPAALVVAGGPVTHTPRLTGPARAWNTEYFTSLRTALQTAGVTVDGYSFHYYPVQWSQRAFTLAVRDYRASIRDAGLPAGAVWVTEINTYDQSVNCTRIVADVRDALKNRDRGYVYAFGADVLQDGMRPVDNDCIRAAR